MWVKGGLIYNVQGDFDWNQTHAQVPVADLLNDRIRIYFATRNRQGKSNVSYIEVDIDNPKKILYIHDSVLFELGRSGAFDDSGIMPSCLININGLKFLYYIGWTTRNTVPFHNAVGLAISEDNGLSFKKVSEGPIITTNRIEPYFSGTSFVLVEDNIFKMWYLSCIEWLRTEADKYEPLYDIKYAESINGIDWHQTGRTAISLLNEEGGLASASVLKRNGIYQMWFGKRKKIDYRENIENSYRIGYAESLDGINWERKDQLAGITLSTKGWDSQMISYPYVIITNKNIFMFYNGNFFGKTGFGYAYWQE